MLHLEYTYACTAARALHSLGHWVELSATFLLYLGLSLITGPLLSPGVALSQLVSRLALESLSLYKDMQNIKKNQSEIYSS